MLKKDPKEIVRFSFRIKNYYREIAVGGDEIIEVRGEKTLKLFKSWFRLMKNRNKLVVGVIEFTKNNEKWIWQPKNPIRTDIYGRGGWQYIGEGYPRMNCPKALRW